MIVSSTFLSPKIFPVHVHDPWDIPEKLQALNHGMEFSNWGQK